METSAPVLTVNPIYKHKDLPTLKAQIIAACEKMDIVALEKLVEDDIFENKNKWEFLAEFRGKFQRIEKLGFKSLEHGFSFCNSCRQGREVVSFKNSKGGIHFGFIFSEENGALQEVYMCNSFENFRRGFPASDNTPYAEPFGIK